VFIDTKFYDLLWYHFDPDDFLVTASL